MKLIEENREKLVELCVNHCVKELYIFGSILTNKFSDASDVDFLIEFTQIDLLDYFDNYMDLKEKLEELLHRPIDLVESQTLRNPIFKASVNSQKVLVYGRKSA
ncbi:MAG: nucleotidyltransferase domain-containing protein [Bacteroidales bacterium]|nr:nucleotidyltransferase domain-containing protein [Bacteroidales bacterium]